MGGRPEGGREGGRPVGGSGEEKHRWGVGASEAFAALCISAKGDSVGGGGENCGAMRIEAEVISF